MKKKLLIILALVFIVYLGYNYIYQDHRNIETEQAAYILSSEVINKEFLQNAAESQAKYLNKTIEISGTITEINAIDLTLDDHVFCLFADSIAKNAIRLNSKITVKGRCIGYDDLLEQIKLDQCSIIN